jgi:hypothetical protein
MCGQALGGLCGWVDVSVCVWGVLGGLCGQALGGLCGWVDVSVYVWAGVGVFGN